MKEISYQIFDEATGLPIETLSDEAIRDIAMIKDMSCSEVFNDLKKAIKKDGVKYMIARGSDTIQIVAKSSMSACQPTYYDDYNDALKALGK